jgi:hypothetical protein
MTPFWTGFWIGLGITGGVALGLFVWQALQMALDKWGKHE